MRLGSWLPFGRVPAELAFFCRVSSAPETVRRLTEGAGAALVASETAEAARLVREWPEPPPGPLVQQLSVDGAMVPLVGGDWAEVKTLALGTVEARVGPDGPEAHAVGLRYFARLAEAEPFGRLATVATHAAGTARAGRVCAVTDGAAWIPGFVDLQRPDAVRILDFPHAVEHLAAAAHAVAGPISPAATAWVAQQAHELKHGDPDRVLAAVAALPAVTAEARATRDRVLGYLTARRGQLAYAAFRAAGYPIGDGAVESANKLLVEARLKGSGMHWAREAVNPMLALRAAICSGRWEPAWAQSCRQRRCRRARPRSRREGLPPAAPPREPVPPTLPVRGGPAARTTRATLVVAGRPTARHPWRAFRLPGSPVFTSPAKR